ncbi:MAG: radical SAM protein [Candidatus Pacebacteria bacterium]|nr:radical SAM protein [Candidatus Paceibacterota bacterium]
MRNSFFSWQNKLKYSPFFQKAFLTLNLSPDFPGLLNIELTNACNLKCVFCPRLSSNREIGFIKKSLFEKIIKELGVEGPIEVLWLMKDGESLLHPQIIELIKIAAAGKAAKRLELYTNGLLLNQSMSQKLINSGLDVLNISLDALDERTYLKLKGVDAYQQVVLNVKRMAGLKKKMKAGKPFLVVKMLETKEVRGQKGKFLKTWLGIADGVVIQKPHKWEGSVQVDPGSRVSSDSGSLSRYPCNLPWLSPAVNWDGKVTSCCVNFQDNELIMGDLNRQSLKQIFQGEKYRQLRRAHLDQDLVKWPTCARCRYWQQFPDMSRRLRKISQEK